MSPSHSGTLTLEKRVLEGLPPSSDMLQLITWYNSEPALVMWSYHHKGTRWCHPSPGREAQTQECSVDSTNENHRAKVH